MNRKMAAGWLLVCLGLTAVLTGWLMAPHVQAASMRVSPPVTDSELIRIHVIAHSDDPADQALKLKVRDDVLADLAPRLNGVGSVREAETVIAQAMPQLEALAGRRISEQGFAYPVRVELGTFAFPGKSYGDLYLPAGNYKALRVVIGDGQGANFWCLVFPTFCYRLYEAQKLPGGSDSPATEPAEPYRW